MRAQQNGTRSMKFCSQEAFLLCNTQMELLRPHFFLEYSVRFFRLKSAASLHVCLEISWESPRLHCTTPIYFTTPINFMCRYPLITGDAKVDMVFSDYTKQRIVFYYQQGLKAPSIASRLSEEGITASRVGIFKFLKSYCSSASIARRPGSGRNSKITDEVKKAVEEKMREDDETMAMQLHQLLTTCGYAISKRTVLRCRSALGWTFRGSSYCQLIRNCNKEKRLEWALRYQNEVAGCGFENVVWSDESSIQLETH